MNFCIASATKIYARALYGLHTHMRMCSQFHAHFITLRSSWYFLPRIHHLTPIIWQVSFSCQSHAWITASTVSRKYDCFVGVSHTLLLFRCLACITRHHRCLACIPALTVFHYASLCLASITASYVFRIYRFSIGFSHSSSHRRFLAFIIASSVSRIYYAIIDV